MKNILLAVRPKWVEKICHEIGKDENGKPIYEKRIEVRKSAPKEVPFKAYIYCTIGNGVKGDYLVPSGIQCGKVIGEFVCDKVYLIKNQGSMFSVADEEQGVTNEIARQSCLDYYDMVSYLGNKDGYGWHISDLKIYDKPKELREFKTGCKGCKERDTYHCKFYCYGERPITRPPQFIVKDMCDLIPSDIWENIESTFLEPACGNGNFLVEILARKYERCTSEKDGLKALASIVGIDIQADNCEECRKRLLEQYIVCFPNANNIAIAMAYKILQNNIICGDSLKIQE